MRKPFILLLSLIALAGSLPAVEYPSIKTLNSSDVVFQQLEADLAQAYQTENDVGRGLVDSGSPAPSGGPAVDQSLLLYRYVLQEEEGLFSLAARLNVPYDALATLNRLPGSGALQKGREILIPSRPGVFIPDRPDSDLEYIMLAGRKAILGESLPIYASRGGKRELFHFFPRARFTGSERAFFLCNLFRFPLPKGTITSTFGMRTNPFGGGKLEFHDGLDLAAPPGTEVYAARKGKVSERGFSADLGNYVVVNHGDGYSTVYGHMQKIAVALNDAVKSGSILGTVGTTGRSTGPHLHFEVRLYGKPQNPQSFIRAR
jgi:murein DD-endopeptidase MepM/ murein hydrolase activator NlpD